jgi:hypothetical protein
VKNGLTLTQLIEVVRNEVPTDKLGDLLQRLPKKYFDPTTQLFRPVAAPILMALSLVEPLDDDDGLDVAVAEVVEIVGADPSPDPAMPAWTELPGGGTLKITALLNATAQRIADLYVQSPKRASKKISVTA